MRLPRRTGQRKFVSIEDARALWESVQHLLAEEGEFQAVMATAWDSMLFDEAVQAAPRLAEVVWAVQQCTHYATDLYRDLFCYFWQASPLVRARGQMRPSRWANWVVVATLADDDEVQRLRRACRHDAMATAATLVALSESIRGWIKSVDPDPKAELAEAAYELGTRIAEAAAQGAADAQAQDGDADEGEGDGLGEAMAQVEAALAKLGEDAPEAGVPDLAALRRGLGESLRSAHEQLQGLAAARSAFGLGSGEAEHIPLGDQVRLGEKLATTRLADFHRLLGRLLGAAAAGPQVSEARSRPKGVRLSGDVTRLLAGELAVLAAPGLQLDFLTRLADEELLSAAHVAPPARGPLVVVVDESASMNEPGGRDERGHVVTRLVWAKALTLALAKQMRAQGRAMQVVSFASFDQQRVWADDPESLLDFASHHFDGNTAIESALDVATGILVDEPAADVVVITDDDRAAPPAAWVRQWGARAVRWRTVGVSVGVPKGRMLRAVCDETVMVEDFFDTEVFARVVALV